MIKTSLTSSQPLNERTSKRAIIASPILSKLNLLGFALNCGKLFIFYVVNFYESIFRFIIQVFFTQENIQD